jgi:hypothetical protein
MVKWDLPINHVRAPICIDHDAGLRPRDNATTLGITERSAPGMADALIAAGFIAKDEDGRRSLSHLGQGDSVRRRWSRADHW